MIVSVICILSVDLLHIRNFLFLSFQTKITLRKILLMTLVETVAVGPTTTADLGVGGEILLTSSTTKKSGN